MLKKRLFPFVCVALISSQTCCSTTVSAARIKEEVQSFLFKLFEPRKASFFDYLFPIPSEIKEYIRGNQLLIVVKNQSDAYTVEKYFYYQIGKTIYSNDEWERLLAEIRFYTKKYVATLILHQWYYEQAQKRLREQRVSFNIDAAALQFADFFFARANDHLDTDPDNTLFEFRDPAPRLDLSFPH